MSRLLSGLHRGQRGVALATLLIILFASASAAWSAVMFFDLFAPDDDSTVVTLPDRAPGYEWMAFGCTASDDTGCDLNGDRGVRVTMPYTLELRESDWRVGRDGAGSSTTYVYINVYVYDGGTCLGDLVCSSSLVPTTSLQPHVYPGSQPWHTFVFGDRPYLVEGQQYIFRLMKSGSADIWTNIVAAGSTTCVGSVTIGYYEDSACYTNGDLDYLVKGYRSAEPTVTTTGHEINLDGSVQLYGTTEVIGDMTCGFLVSDDYATVVAGTGTEYEAGTSGWNAGRHLFNYRLAFLQNGVQYSYRAYASAYGQTWYGSVLNFTRTQGDIPLSLRCDVIENSPDRVLFESAVAGINASESVTYNVTIAYGTNQTGCQASNGTISVATNISTDDIWRTQVNPVTEFEEGTRYFYRLAVAGNDSSLAYSGIQSFTTWDSDTPPWIQRIIFWINERFGTHLTIESAWWWVVLMLLLLSWTVAGLLRWKWVGVIGTGAIFMWLVVMGRVPSWVVILAVLLAAWIIFKLVFTRAHEETGD